MNEFKILAKNDFTHETCLVLSIDFVNQVEWSFDIIKIRMEFEL